MEGKNSIPERNNINYILILIKTKSRITIPGANPVPPTGSSRANGLISICAIPGKGTRKFTPPSGGRGNDWILILDDAARGFNTGF